jgi:hypothetical protein
MSMKASSKARKQEKAARSLKMDADRLAQQREIRQAMREQRIKQAQILQAGANQGVTGSSGVTGGVASTGSQLAGNVNFINQQGAYNQAISGALQRASSASGRAANWSALAGLGSSAFSAAGGFGAFDKNTIPKG